MTEFTKAHGNGNDFIIIDEWDGERVHNPSGFAEKYCDRRFGVGGDGVLFLRRPEDTTNDLRMVLIQPDGGEAEMCGNGARCLVRYAVGEGYAQEGEEVQVETLAGVREAVCRGEDDEVRVEMGVPSFDAGDVPARRALVEEEVGGWEVTAVNTGVPHAVTFVENLDGVNVEEAAPSVRHADVFPEGANVNFVEKEDDAFRVRTFERGVEDETLACGTGAVAVAAVARRLGKTDDDEVRVETRGGPLTITFENETAYMRGSAVLVYEGETL